MSFFLWLDIQPSLVTQLTHPKCTHTHTADNSHTHTQQWTHTRSSGQFMLRRPGSSWGFGVLLKGTSVVVLRVERALYIHSPPLQSLPDRDSNTQPFNYESDSRTIRPRLPLILLSFRYWHAIVFAYGGYSGPIWSDFEILCHLKKNIYIYIVWCLTSLLICKFTPICLLTSCTKV